MAFGAPITLASGATLVLQANGDFTFDPRGAFDFVPEGGRSADGIWYTAIDQNGAVSDEVHANFSALGVNDAPVAVHDMLAAVEGTPITNHPTARPTTSMPRLSTAAARRWVERP